MELESLMGIMDILNGGLVIFYSLTVLTNISINV